MKVAKLESALESGLVRDRERDDSIRRFGEKIHPFRDGRSSARVIDTVESILEHGLKVGRRKPLNVIRELKMRSQLNFWWP